MVTAGGRTDRCGVTSPARFTDAVRPHLGVVGTVARRFAPGGEAEEVAQEALLAAWRSRRRFDPERGTFRAWLLAIVLSECRRAGLRRVRRGQLAAALALQARPEASAADPGSLAESIEAAIADLARRQREVIMLYYFVDLPVDEVAAVLGLSPGTVKSTLADARAKIRRQLEGDV